MHNHPGVENHMGSLNSRKSALIGKSRVDGASSMQLADGIYSNLTWQREIPTVAMEKKHACHVHRVLYAHHVWIFIMRWMTTISYIHSLTLAHTIINGGFSIAGWDDQRGPQLRTDYLSELLPYVPSLLFLIPLLLVSRSHNFHWTLWRVLVKSGKPKNNKVRLIVPWG